MSAPAIDRVLARTVIDGSGCWPCTMAHNGNGYITVSLGGRGSKQTTAHRVVYEHFIENIPEGMTIDHLCKNRACMNPDHMEVVTPGENALRGDSQPARNARATACKSGHEFTPQNTLVRSNGRRKCRECDRLRAQSRRSAA